MAAYFIFAATYVVLAAGRFPGLRIDRTGAALTLLTLVFGAWWL